MLKIIQMCDMCGEERTISRVTDSHLEQGGWAKIPVNRRFGSSRDEQPTLCTDCQDKVWNFICQMKQAKEKRLV